MTVKVFRARLEIGLYLIRGDRDNRLEDAIDYIIFAEEKPQAEALVHRFVGDRIGSSSPRISHAMFDDISDAIERLDRNDPRYRELADVLADATIYSGSISMAGAVLVRPDNDNDTLIIPLSEGERTRVLIEPAYLMDRDDGGLQWKEPKSPLTAIDLAKSVQAIM